MNAPSNLQSFAAMLMDGEFVTRVIVSAWRTGPDIKRAREIAPDLTAEQFEHIGLGLATVGGNSVDGFTLTTIGDQ